MRTYNIIGLVALGLYIIATFLKSYHLPGAGILFILTTFLLVAFFAPLRLQARLKSDRPRLFSIIEYVTLTALSMAAIFKVMHWPGSPLIAYFFFGTFTLFYLPSYIYYGFKQRQNREEYFFTIVIGGLIIMLFKIYMSGQVSKRMLDSYDLALVKQGEFIEIRQIN